MAVEIPVVIDIDKAFQDAASRVNTAIKPLESALDSHSLTAQITIGNLEQSSNDLKALSKYFHDLEAADWSRIGSKLDLSPYINQSIMQLRSLEKELNEIQELRQMEGGSGDFSFAEEYRRIKTEIDKVIAGIQAMQNAQKQLNASLASDGFQSHIRNLTGSNEELRKMNEYYRELEAQTAKMGDSINAIRSRLADLNAEWNNMSKADRGSARGTALINQAREETRLLKEEALTIEQILQKEQRKSELIKKGIQNRRYEQAILNATAVSMRVLQEQERILSDRLNRTRIESNKYEELKQQLEEVRSKMREVQGEVDKTSIAMGKQSRVLQNLTSLTATYVSLYGALRFAKQIRDVTGELEYQRVALGHLIQDEAYGVALFDKIKQEAVKSPFRIKELVTYTKQLAAYRIETENLFDVTHRLADVSAGLGVDMNRLILAYGQVRAASVLRGQELRQFTEAGIPLVELLAEKMGELNKQTYSTADVFKLISARAVPFSAIADIFEDLTDKGGMFYKMQEEQAKTLKGRWEKLKDTYDIALQSIGESQGLLSFSSYNNLIIKGLELLAKELRLIPKILEGGTAAWLIYYAATIKSRNAIRAARIAEVEGTFATEAASLAKLKGVKNTNAYTRALILQRAATTGLGRAFYGLWAAMVANPIGAVISAISGLAIAFFSFRKSTDQATNDVAQFKETVESLANIDKTYQKTDKLISSYEELATKADKTAAENKRLYSTMSKLSDIFPDLSSKIDDETASIDENVKAMKEKNELNRENARAEIEQQLNAAKIKRESLKAQLSENEEERAKAYQRMKEEESLLNFYHLGSQKALDKAIKKYEEWDRKVRESREAVNSLTESIESFENFLNPKPVDEQTKGWKDQILKMNDYVNSLGKVQIFTPKEIEDLETVNDYYKDLSKRWKEAKVEAEGLKKAYEDAVDPIIKSKLLVESQDADALFKALDAMREFFGFKFTKDSGGGAAKTDPFITLMQNRIKFMQDFKKGYDDLSKFMTSSQAKIEESGIMLGRGQSLGLGAEEQMRAVTDLSKWYEDMIKSVQDKLRAKGVKGTTPTDFLSIDTAKKGKAIQDLQKLLQQLWDAKTDYDTSQKKKEIEDALKRLSDEIKQTETARNFYNDILDITGDEQLAATIGVSIYGNVGQDFKDAMQRQLNEAMKQIDSDQLSEELRQAFAAQDFKTILANLDKFPEEWRKRVQEMAADSQKFEADRAKNLLKALQKFKTYGDQQVELSKQTARRRAEIEAMGAPDSVKSQLLEQNAKKEAEESAKIAYEAFRDMPMYIELFDDLDAASGRMLESMRKNLEDMRDNWKALSPRELKELQTKINDLDEQIARKNPFKALISSIREYRNLQQEQSRSAVEEAAISANDKMIYEKEVLELYQKQYDEAVKKYKIDSEEVKQAELDLEVQSSITNLAIEEAKEAQKTASEYKEAAKHIQDAAEAMEEWSGYVTDSMDGIGQIVSTFASDDVADTFNIIAEGVGKTLTGVTELGKGVGKVMAGDLTGIVDIIKGTGDFIAGTFGTSNALKIKSINKKIDDQQDLLDKLTYSYDRLDKAIAKAFGSDYIYNYTEQLKNLQAQQAAYEEQVRLEREKGKKKDEDKIQDYENSIREVEDAIEEMDGKLSEFFTGTDVHSAAEEFAQSWIDAYVEFGSTTDAMKEKFQDMINNMITKSLAGKIMQNMLDPIFKEIDRLALDGDLTADEIGRISTMATEAIPQIDSAMTTLMNSLTTAGIDLRTHAGQFTGISRDIAGASEESILGLAAAVNTANFYISYVPAIAENVAALRAAIAGDTPATVRTTASEGPTYEDQMLGYAANLPLMRDDTNAIRTLLERVIKPNGSAYYVSVR